MYRFVMQYIALSIYIQSETPTPDAGIASKYIVSINIIDYIILVNGVNLNYANSARNIDYAENV